MIRRLRTVKPSKVDAAFEKLKVGESIPVTGSLSHWRNRQANFHNKYPDAWIRLSQSENGPIAERLV